MQGVEEFGFVDFFVLFMKIFLEKCVGGGGGAAGTESQ